MKNKGVFFLIAIVALVGIFNCVVVEPAYAQVHEHAEAHEQESDGHCDVICHLSHHVWNVESQSILFEQPLVETQAVLHSIQAVPNPPVQGIFHPPATL